MRVYIATRLENHRDHNRLRDLLAERGIGLTYDWTTHGPVWRDGPDRIRAVAQAEALGVTSADLVIVLLPGGRGTHAELGIAIGAGIPVLLVPSLRSQVEGEGVCAFYLHPLVTISRHAELERLGAELGANVWGQP